MREIILKTKSEFMGVVHYVIDTWHDDFTGAIRLTGNATLR